MVDKRQFLTLLGLSMLGAIAVLPYVLTLQGDLIRDSLTVPLWVMLVVSIVQSAVLFSVAVYVGLRLLPRVGLRLLPQGRFISSSIAWGILVGVAIIVMDLLFVWLTPFSGYGDAAVAPVWQALLASLYGGISEEVLLRLFFMTLLIWLFSKIFRMYPSTAWLVWSAIVVSAVIFGIAHLPTAAALGPVTAIVIVRTITLNAIGGIIFGWLFWKQGLAAAVVAHFCADIILHVLAPLVL